MHTTHYSSEDKSATAEAKLTPFEAASVTLSKQEHIQLIWNANYWKSSYERAIVRMGQLEFAHRKEIEQYQLREATLRNELEIAQAKIRDLQKRVFGRKSENRSSTDKAQESQTTTRRPRGQQHGTPGHGRTIQTNLPTQIETVEMDSPRCSCCGLDFADFPGTEDSEVLEIEVSAYRRVIRRRRHRKTCQCEGVPAIISAPPPARLIPRGKLGISVWVHLLLSKFLYGQPTHRLLRDLCNVGLTLSQGTLTGGLQTIAPLFAPLEDALLARLRSETHWHADETRWMVFCETEGKIGHRWYLWVFQSASVIHYVLDPTRSADVPVAELGCATGGTLSVDRYSAYKKFVRLYPAFALSFCWAHQRRDFIELANSYPELVIWAFGWVDKIGEVYRLNSLRSEAGDGSETDPGNWAKHDQHLRKAIENMAQDCDTGINDPSLAEPAAKVLQSMKNHWVGLTVFVDHPEVPMDNNSAERTLRTPVVGRKNFYGSGSQWSGKLAATMYSLLMTVQLWDLNPRTWLSTYLHACAANGNRPPVDLAPFLPWSMNACQLAAMKSVFVAPGNKEPKGIDSS
jgi:transposase